MKAREMKERVSHNFGLKVLSLALAALLWIVVINSQDPVETVTFEDVPVTIINEEALIAKDKIPEVVEGDSVKVTGHSCPKGEEYAINECTNPVRTVTATVRVEERRTDPGQGNRKKSPLPAILQYLLVAGGIAALEQVMASWEEN